MRETDLLKIIIVIIMCFSNRFDTRALRERTSILQYLKMVKGVVIKRLFWARNSYPAKAGEKQVQWHLRSREIFKVYIRKSKGSGLEDVTQINIFKIKWFIVSDSLQPHGLYIPWNSLGQNTGVGSLSLLQGIFPIQGSNTGLLPCRWIL